jgi:Ca2+-transporting ATPase
VDTICTDKTGTLTQNIMTVQRLFADGRLAMVPQGGVDDAGLHEVLQAGILCNDATRQDGTTPKIIGDPVDTALLRAAQMAGIDIGRVRADYLKVNEMPFSSERKMMTTIHQRDGRWVAYTKGAPEVVLARCGARRQAGQSLPLEDKGRLSIDQAIERLESEGMYVLALAQKEMPATAATDGVERDMTFIGLQALMDPPRPEVANAVAHAQSAGIRVVMVTGDHALTARAIAGPHAANQAAGAAGAAGRGTLRGHDRRRR